MLDVILGQMVVMGSWGLETIALSRWMLGRERKLQQQQHQEEEQETCYVSAAELSVESKGATPSPTKDARLVGWEFKIVRAQMDVFRDRAQLQKLCEEEAQAGWILLEKLDDRRVRFKRPIALRDLIDPKTLQFDAYRCHYGPQRTAKSWLGAIALVGAMIFPAGLGYVWVNANLNARPATSPEPTRSPVAEPFPERPLSPIPGPKS